MKESGKCPKCDSSNIANPWSTQGFRYWCKDCGFVEIYASTKTVTGLIFVYGAMILFGFGLFYWVYDSSGL